MFVINPVDSDCGVPDVFAGVQVRASLRSWVTPPDPSTNHNIACGIQLDGTAQWFFRGGIFSEWKSTGTLLWIYGKRMFSLLVPDPLLMTIRILSGLWEEHPLVSHLSMLYPKTNLQYLAALLSFKTSKLYAKQDWRVWPTFILTSEISISKIAETSFYLFLSNSPLSPVPVVTPSTNFIWNMTKDHMRLVKQR
jgi:hypothetical protein